MPLPRVSLSCGLARFLTIGFYVLILRFRFKVSRFCTILRFFNIFVKKRKRKMKKHNLRLRFVSFYKKCKKLENLKKRERKKGTKKRKIKNVKKKY